MKALLALPTLFILLWSALTLAFDVKIAWDLTHQVLSMRHARTSGTITHSRMVQRRDSDGSTYGFEVRYAYEVDGRRYEGTRHRYGAMNTSDREPAEDAERRFPVGATVSVFHHPEAPADAVLVTGVQGDTLFLLLFMNPFNLVMLAGWYGALAASRKGKEDDDTLLGVFTHEGRVHVRLEGMSVLAAGALALGGASFVSILVVGLAGGSSSLPVVVLTWGAVIAAGVVFARKQRAKLASGEHDLILDERRRWLSLPEGPGREERLDVPWNRVTSVVLGSRVTKDSDGDTRTRWCPTVVLGATHAEERNEVLVEWNDEHKAKVLVRWLKSRLGHAEAADAARRPG